MDLEKAFAGCSLKKEKKEKIDCMFKVLYEITSQQDGMNISIIKAINDDTDPRWKGVHMIDNANAIILGLARNKCNPVTVVEEGYVGEKVNSLDARWWDINALARKLEAKR